MRTRLTPREAEVFEQLLSEHSRKEIAYRMRLSTKTLDTHAKHIYAKLGVHTRSGLLIYAAQQGLIRKPAVVPA